MSSIERQTELNVVFLPCVLVVGEITPLTVDTRRLEAFHMKCHQHVARIQYRQIGEACCILPVKQCVNFKSVVYVYRALHNTATQYLVEDCQCQLNCLRPWSTPTAICGRRHLYCPAYKSQESTLATGAFRLLVRGCGTVYQWSCASHTLK